MILTHYSLKIVFWIPKQKLSQKKMIRHNVLWRNILWNNDKGTMIVNNQKLTERILLYFWDRSTLTPKEISTMKLEIKSNRQLANMEDVDSLLDDAIDK